MKTCSPARMRKALALSLALAAFALLAAESASAASAARQGLLLCARVIIPSLLPFFVLSSLLSALGLPRALSRAAAPLMSRLFRVSGAGAAAFLIGLTGGYPLGAATVADLYRRGELDAPEARRLLCFCNNSGPAFIIGAAGSGVFGSGLAGALLYAVHVTAAVLTGLIFSRTGKKSGVGHPAASASGEPEPFSTAFPQAVRGAVDATLAICGFVVFFSVLTGILEALGLFASAAGALAVHLGLGLGQARALLAGILELGGGIGGMLGLPPTPANMALAAFLLGWGGLSVQCQTLAVLSGTPLGRAPLLLSKLLHAALSAALAGLLWLVIV